MWPWEHFALGYLLYSGYSWLRHRQPPSGAAVVVLLVATQVPDLVDKPLAWTFGVLPSGTSFAHSVFTTALLVPLGMVLSRRYGRPTYGVAFAIGYSSHLLGDVLYPMLTEGEVGVGYLLWPIVPQRPATATGFVTELQDLVGDFLFYLDTPGGVWYLLFEIAFLVGTLLLWLRDGKPGLNWLRERLGGARRLSEERDDPDT